MNVYYKATISAVNVRNNQKTGEYMSIEFTYFDETNQVNLKANKNCFINHPNEELAKKARQILYRMKSYFAQNPQDVDNNILLDKKCFITINDQGNYHNVNQVYFLR